ncbi:Sbal_3080 family lipoprotein [Bordetella sp. FB-8]|uniref:Sbal_3080 family lipoprotein n=1 Tax=Bordetella sp. FB-8 TaxID=1159870 RepID=UPI00037EADE3|nr:Sbal_3080 family lipoprotein [Bordetella sp. FB-8]
MKKSLLCGLLLLAGCTSINVKPLALDTGAAPKHVCIQYNPAVAVNDFLSVVTAGFERHGIKADVYKDNTPPDCQYTMTYTATRNWDIVPYMNHAELHIFKDGKQVAEAEYTHHGGFALTKYASNEEKMTPVIDELLAGIK